MLRTIFIASIFLLSPICFAEKIADHVVIVSIDGGKPSTIEKTDLPNIKALAKTGSVSWNAQTILPSATLMSHASMISGVDMDVHGVNVLFT
ncbi:MAG: alkaline phosphatase family protein [Oligoflexia bacterium]|nr:alkaline phosphatase family protein [Oligoflexia bacterium]